MDLFGDQSNKRLAFWENKDPAILFFPLLITGYLSQVMLSTLEPCLVARLTRILEMQMILFPLCSES